MGSVVFNCEHCGQSLESDTDLLGQKVECPNCKRIIWIKPSKNMRLVEDIVNAGECSPSDLRRSIVTIKVGYALAGIQAILIIKSGGVISDTLLAAVLDPRESATFMNAIVYLFGWCSPALITMLLSFTVFRFIRLSEAFYLFVLSSCLGYVSLIQAFIRFNFFELIK